MYSPLIMRKLNALRILLSAMVYTLCWPFGDLCCAILCKAKCYLYWMHIIYYIIHLIDNVLNTHSLYIPFEWDFELMFLVSCFIIWVISWFITNKTSCKYLCGIMFSSYKFLDSFHQLLSMAIIPDNYDNTLVLQWRLFKWHGC